MKYIMSIPEVIPFDFYSELVLWCNNKDYLCLPHKEVFWFNMLLEFLQDYSKKDFIDSEIFIQLLRFQYVKRIKVAG